MRWASTAATVSPDGNLIAFAAEVYPEIGGADGKANKAAIERKAKNPIQAHIADHLLYRHWTEYSDGKYWHIIVYNLKNKTYTDVTPGRLLTSVLAQWSFGLCVLTRLQGALLSEQPRRAS